MPETKPATHGPTPMLHACAANTKPIYRKMGPAGPANWPGVCGAGRAQSPINLPLPDTKRRWSSGQDPNSIRYGELIFNYGRARAGFVSNPGHGSPQVCEEGSNRSAGALMHCAQRMRVG